MGKALNVRSDRWNRTASFKFGVALRTTFHGRGGQMHGANVFDVATAARFRSSRDIGMMRPHLVTTQASGIGHIVTRADDRQPTRSGNNGLVARIAFLREHRVRRRHRSRGKRSRIPRRYQAYPHDSGSQRNQRQPPLPQANRRALFEVVEVMPLGDRLRCAFTNCQARPPFELQVVSSQWRSSTGNWQLATGHR